MPTTERRWRDKDGITHSVVRRVLSNDNGWPAPRRMVTRCAGVRVPDRALAFDEVDCIACLVAKSMR